MTACHVRIGAIPWCQCSPPPPGLLAEAGRRRVNINCRQVDAANAVALVHMLQDLGVKDATVADGLCEWDPEDRELKRLAKRPRAASPA